jgi:hypothetical protein
MTARLSNRPALWRIGAYLGMLAAFAFVVLVPAGLREAGFHAAKAWGLGSMTAPICCLGAIPGALIADLRYRSARRLAGP